MSENQIKSSKIDTMMYERWFHRILSYWHIFLISFAIALFGIQTYLKYTTSIYSASSTIIVKDATQNINPFDTKGGSMDNPYSRNYNLLNEIKILSSKRLIDITLQELNWTFNGYLEGKLKATEMYKDFPFTISKTDSVETFINKRLYFNVLSDNEFKIYSKEDDLMAPQIQNFGKYFTVNGIEIKIDKKEFIFGNIGSTFSFSFNSLKNLSKLYASKLKINQVDKNSSVLALFSQGPNVQKEIDFLNTHCQTFMRISLSDKNAANDRTIKFIELQLQTILDTLIDLESQITLYRKKFSGSNMELLLEKRFAKLDVLEEEKAKFLLSNRYFDYLKDYITSKSDYTDIVAPASVGVQDAILSKLLTELMELKSKQNTTFKAEQNLSPFRIDNENKINQVKKNITEVIKNIENTNKILIDDLSDRISSLQGKASNLFDNEKYYIELKRRYKINEELYNMLLKKNSEMSIIRAGTVGDTKVVDFAYITGRVSPDIAKIYTTYLLLAFLLPLIYVFLKYMTNYRVMDKEDVIVEANIPFLGSIGHIPDNDNMVIINKPNSSLSESFRSIRANLSFFMSGSNQKVILITSSVSGDGKTFTSLNIASIIALSGKKIVLIGADMRKPKVYLDIEVKNTLGLSNFLANKATAEEIIKTTKFENLYFISSGPVPPNPSELLMSNKLEDLISYLKIHYDYILFDTPPLGIVSDALTIMKHSDVNIYVVRHNYTQTSYLKELAEYITAGNIKNMTFVMNDYNVYKNYGYGYKYTSAYGNYAKSKSKHGYYIDDEKPKAFTIINKISNLFKK